MEDIALTVGSKAPNYRRRSSSTCTTVGQTTCLPCLQASRSRSRPRSFLAVTPGPSVQLHWVPLPSTYAPPQFSFLISWPVTYRDFLHIEAGSCLCASAPAAVCSRHPSQYTSPPWTLPYSDAVASLKTLLAPRAALDTVSAVGCDP